ncbi:acyl-CoA dehydrogenase [Collibacillus ludicampi]|uniref:Acyl-CoA dehydrogenase n=1 Tax=Collibacillus ludicampi TaxID=2771369 RepID=A0AAV4LK38_9BACL|nr:acyl-CoA dehydrogenase family protein [Collibacillus ludicampi]GIM47983.1 acyl-CoA dehydrogenase [Collibacillus ludicampi]
MTVTKPGLLDDLIEKNLRPIVTSIDENALYPGDFLKILGREGFFSQNGNDEKEHREKTMFLIERVAEECNSTAFLIWCHTTAIRFVRNSDNDYLKQEILPLLENGQRLGGTGLSNSMKYYAGMESLKLKAQKTNDGFLVSGTLPYVSNVGRDHWFGIIAEVSDSNRMMAFVPCHVEGLHKIQLDDFLGLNGTATYSCRFEHVLVPYDWVLAHDADSYVKRIRPEFVLNQTGMALGLVKASVKNIERLQKKQNNANSYLDLQPNELNEELKTLRDNVYKLVRHPKNFKEILQSRLDGANLAIKAAHAEMLHSGGAGYVRHSPTSRRLREAYFLNIVTPAVKQLKKLLNM